jgi:hypothetical protein
MAGTVTVRICVPGRFAPNAIEIPSFGGMLMVMTDGAWFSALNTPPNVVPETYPPVVVKKHSISGCVLDCKTCNIA